MLIALMSLAIAADPHAEYLSAAFKACDDKASEPIASARCAESEAKRQAALLDKEWAAALTQLPAKIRPEADKAQAAWKQFRDLDCGLPGKMDLGPGVAAYYAATCRMNRAIERRMDLVAYPELHDGGQ